MDMEIGEYLAREIHKAEAVYFSRGKVIGPKTKEVYMGSDEYSELLRDAHLMMSARVPPPGAPVEVGGYKVSRVAVRSHMRVVAF